MKDLVRYILRIQEQFILTDNRKKLQFSFLSLISYFLTNDFFIRFDVSFALQKHLFGPSNIR